MLLILRQLFADQSAVTAIEYTLIVALISVAAISTMTTLGQKLMNMLGPAANAMT
jgi:Flp pilus assembly pilin Flp